MPEILLERVCAGLGLTPRKLATTLGLSYKHEVQPLENVQPHHVAHMSYDPVWLGIQELVDTRLGLLLAVRDDIATQAHKGRVKLTKRREEIRNR